MSSFVGNEFDMQLLLFWTINKMECSSSFLSILFTRYCRYCYLTIGRTGGVGSGCHPHKVFWVFFFLDDNTLAPDQFSVAVPSFLPYILRQVQWWAVAMVTRYVISSRWSSHFLVKVHVLSTFATIKVTVVAKIMQSAYLFVIFHGKHKNLPFLAVLTCFLILGQKIQDGDNCWWRHRPPAAPPPIKYTITSS